VTDQRSHTRSDVGGSQAAIGETSLADEIIDELLPHELDWRSVVVSHPKLSVSLVALVGFWLGRTRGRAILGGITTLAADTVDESINEFFGRDVI